MRGAEALSVHENSGVFTKAPALSVPTLQHYEFTTLAKVFTKLEAAVHEPLVRCHGYAAGCEAGLRPAGAWGKRKGAVPLVQPPALVFRA